MERTLLGDLEKKIGERVKIAGWVSVRRDQGKMVFLDLRDRSGVVQGVVLPSEDLAIAVAKEIRAEFVIASEATVTERPPKNINPDVQNGNLELHIHSIQILSRAEVPFERNTELNLDTYLDHFPYTVRSDRAKDIFRVQETIIKAFRASLRVQGFTEFQAPVLAGADAEGGAATFEVKYLYDQKAYLATSPQLYKQMMVGAFERVFTTAKVFRGEKHATTRHLSEIVQMDFEMAFINDHREVLEVLENVIRAIVLGVSQEHETTLRRFNTAAPLLPTGKFPVLTLSEAQDKLGAPHEPDLEPEQERGISEWAKKEHGSDFVFITHFPTAARAFYTYEDPKEAPLSRGFDLLFRGLEINSGAQRIHDYDQLVARIKERGMNPEKFSYYLQAFRVGMPPHGGCSTGLERITARMLELTNVKEATLFPRDLNRIDTLLSTSDKTKVDESIDIKTKNE